LYRIEAARILRRPRVRAEPPRAVAASHTSAAIAATSNSNFTAGGAGGDPPWSRIFWAEYVEQHIKGQALTYKSPFL